MKNKFVKYVLLFILGAIIYYLVELLFRGYSYLIMSFVGGTMFIICDKTSDNLPWTFDLFYQGIICSCYVTAFELFIGTLWKCMNLSPMWDYSNLWLNYEGVICPLFSFLWIFLCMFGIILADSFNYYLLKNGSRPMYRLLGIIDIAMPIRK